MSKNTVGIINVRLFIEGQTIPNTKLNLQKKPIAVVTSQLKVQAYEHPTNYLN